MWKLDATAALEHGPTSLHFRQLLDQIRRQDCFQFVDDVSNGQEQPADHLL